MVGAHAQRAPLPRGLPAVPARARGRRLLARRPAAAAHVDARAGRLRGRSARSPKRSASPRASRTGARAARATTASPRYVAGDAARRSAAPPAAASRCTCCTLRRPDDRRRAAPHHRGRGAAGLDPRHADPDRRPPRRRRHGRRAAELSATAALLELARVFAARETKRTIVLVSTSGGSGGDAGAQSCSRASKRPACTARSTPRSCSATSAAAKLRRPIVVPYSDGLGSAPLALARTVADAIKHEAGSDPGAPSTLGQLAHLDASPRRRRAGRARTPRGCPPCSCRPAANAGPRAGERDRARERLEGLGRGVLSAVDALDTAPDVPPALQTGLRAAAQDDARVGAAPAARHAAAAAARRRGRRPRAAAPPPPAASARWTLWTLACALPFLCCALFCWLLGRLGIIGAAPVGAGARRRAAARRRGDRPALVAVGAHVRALVAAARARCCAGSGLRAACPARRRGRRAVDGAAALALACVVWIVNPYTALLLVPPLHLWLLIASPELRPRRALALGLVALGLRAARAAGRLLRPPARLRPGRAAWAAVLLRRRRARRARLGAAVERRASAAPPRVALVAARARPAPGRCAARRRAASRSRSADRSATPAPARSGVRSRLCDDRGR